MTIQVLNSLWDKICNVFATKSELADIVENKQDRLTAGIGIRIEGNTIINQAIPTTDKEEIVQVAITFDSLTSLPSGFDITEDLPITVFCNNESESFGTYNLDSYGMCSFTIPYGYRYRIEFPTILGYNPISDEEHVATVIERSIEKKYITTSSEEDHSGQELVEVLVQEKVNFTFTKLEGVELRVEINGENPITYTTDVNGKAKFYVDRGLQYIITAPEREGWYFSGFDRRLIYTADSAQRVIIFEYRLILSGLYIVTDTGNEYTITEWKNALENEEVTNLTLIDNLGVFAIGIDEIRTRSFGMDAQRWCNIGISGTTFTTIPGNGIDEYNGYDQTCKIIQEATDRGIGVPAASKCYNLHFTLNNIDYPGFLGTGKLWLILWFNCVIVDDILLLTRPIAPEGSTYYTFTSLTVQKWTSSQYNNSAYYFSNILAANGTGANTNKYSIYYVIPFYAYN